MTSGTSNLALRALICSGKMSLREAKKAARLKSATNLEAGAKHGKTDSQVGKAASACQGPDSDGATSRKGPNPSADARSSHYTWSSNRVEIGEKIGFVSSKKLGPEVRAEFQGVNVDIK